MAKVFNFMVYMFYHTHKNKIGKSQIKIQVEMTEEIYILKLLVLSAWKLKPQMELLS